MNDDIDTLDPPTPAAPVPTPDVGPDAVVGPKKRFHHRVIGMRGVAAVALASVILGGAGGLALGALGDGADADSDPGGRGGPGGNFQQGPFPDGQQGQFPGGQQGGPGVAPPAGDLLPGTAPKGDVAPGDSSDTTTDQNS